MYLPLQVVIDLPFPRPRQLTIRLLARVGCTSQDSITGEPRTLLCAPDVHGHTRDNPAGLGMPLASRRVSSTRKRTRKVAWLWVTFVEHFDVATGRRALLVMLAIQLPIAQQHPILLHQESHDQSIAQAKEACD
jgi:hypothetical protein